MDIKKYAVQCFRDEAKAILDLANQLDEDFDRIIDLILRCKGKLIIMGVGKSGHCGAKIAATLASTGTPSFFINPLDAFHGDLGMISDQDIVLMISNSGKTDELLRLVPHLIRRKVPLIAMTGNPSSLLGKHSNFHLNIAVEKEACPLNLAPTSSTTATMAMGDAIACTLIEMRGFEDKDFAVFHPGGSLGKRLLSKVEDVMYKEGLPKVARDAKLSEAIIEISRARLGLAVVEEDGKVAGLITDGDVRRAMTSRQSTFFELIVEDIMTTSPLVVKASAGLADAQVMMEESEIHTLVVIDDLSNYVGVVDMRNIM